MKLEGRNGNGFCSEQKFVIGSKHRNFTVDRSIGVMVFDQVDDPSPDLTVFHLINTFQLKIGLTKFTEMGQILLISFTSVG